MTEGDVALATDPGALVLSAAPHDAMRLVAAVKGVLAGQRVEPLPASPIDGTQSNQSV